MPAPTQWTAQTDAALRDMLGRQRVSLREAEARTGISRSVLSKRAYALGIREQNDDHSRHRNETAPLAAGHEITWACVAALLTPIADEALSYAVPAYA